ncbi:polysaccharide biosynthesis protein [Arsenicicoccus sp. UBA7492]|uniref:polysaccharide biosynthesis protein n=1 Tax=Arsenicicoccus sp. UBA7492 TaxID=1946057 RepID=UPI00257E9211|nr:nucleoside-diphosphate sugar epimerase/dehydratase [Arsenicicoccus sp. UBA7492]
MLAPRRRDRFVRVTWCLIDASVWVVAIYAATWLRHAYELEPTFVRNTAIVAGAAALGHVVVSFATGPYRKGHVRGSFEEVLEVAATVAIVCSGLMAWAMTARPIVVPRTVPIMAALIASLAMMATRFVIRAARQRHWATLEGKERILVFGAGNGGRLLIRNLRHDPTSPYIPVALLDDDRGKRRRSFDGVRVSGGRKDIAKVAERYDADKMVIAIPSAGTDTIRELRQAAMEAGVKALVVPTMSAMVGRTPTSHDIRDINLEDLLGRRPITLDQSSIATTLENRVVLVTGAGGSIGSELCRQIAKFHPAKLVMLDRDESALQSVQLDLDGHGLLQNDSIVLADIRDQEAMQRVFGQHRPQVVFHAAALKHLPLLERYPLEAWKSNVLGTLNVLRAAQASGVQTFVNISTDKAADPVCVLGYSKRIAERLTADVAQQSEGRYMSVRFGNVLGSRGSVIPAFTRQITQGGPVTVTHPDVQRYFMLIPEACQLVMQAATMGDHGEVMVLDMGTPVRIKEIAETLIGMSGRQDVEIVYTGLRPGEKMSEDLFNAADESRVTAHPLVTSVDVPRLDGTTVDGMPLTHERAAGWMRGCAREGQGPLRHLQDVTAQDVTDTVSSA